ncbi:MAG TPA: hypothetical protein VFD45_03150 [Patescibacteria group bacterium]|nr:hypothetical protein [Patescibacteria group bacterium]
MEELKKNLIRLLEELDYKSNKEEFVDEFLSVCHQQAISTLLKGGQPTEDLEDHQYQESLKDAVLSNIRKAIDLSLPTLNHEQLTKFSSYIDSIPSDH